MEESELQVRTMFCQMLADVEQHAKVDEDYRNDMEGLEARVQWEIGSTKGYQVFERGKYSFKINAEIEDPDITLRLNDLGLARRLLSGESEDFVANNFGREIEIAIAKKDFPLMKLSRIPGLRPAFEAFLDHKNATGTLVPINKSLGNFENQVLPLAVVEHFINKASHIFLMNHCRCRVVHNCKRHDHSLACTWMGRGVLKINVSPEVGRRATREEALTRSRLAYENGLVPTLGRLRGDSFIMGALPDTGHFMSLCYCCSCCCILGTWKYAAKPLRDILHRMEGISVAVDRETCDGCGLCLEVCIFDGMGMVDGKPSIDQDKCLGCGRCERECPNDAISIAIDDYKGYDKMIARTESYVDVT